MNFDGSERQLDEARVTVEVDGVSAPEALQAIELKAIELTAGVYEEGRAEPQDLLGVLRRRTEPADLDEEAPQKGDPERRVVHHRVGGAFRPEGRPPERRQHPAVGQEWAAVVIGDSDERPFAREVLHAFDLGTEVGPKGVEQRKRDRSDELGVAAGGLGRIDVVRQEVGELHAFP